MKKSILVTIMIVVVLILAMCLVACENKQKKLQDTYEKFLKAEKNSLIDGKVFVNHETYLTFDSMPDDKNKLVNGINFTTISLFLNSFMNFDSSLEYAMKHTSALDGIQTYEEDGYIIRWTYHPDHGLEGSIKVKK